MPRTEPDLLARLEKMAREHDDVAAMWSRSGPHNRLVSQAASRAALLREAIAALRGNLPAKPFAAPSDPFRPLPSPAGSGDASEH